MKTFSPIQGMYECVNDTGSYVLKSDYDRVVVMLTAADRRDLDNESRAARAITPTDRALLSIKTYEIKAGYHGPHGHYPNAAERAARTSNQPFNPLDHEQTK